MAGELAGEAAGELAGAGAAEPGGNRRGRRAKEEILDATARVMALRGYAATTISTITAETGLPRSAIYHHFRSKGGLLSAVMARGARDFFAAMRTAHRDPPEGGSHRERMAWYLDRTAEVLAAQPDFMRLHFLLLLSDEATEAEVAEMNRRVRDEARAHIRAMISAVFADRGPRPPGRSPRNSTTSPSPASTAPSSPPRPTRNAPSPPRRPASPTPSSPSARRPLPDTRGFPDSRVDHPPGRSGRSGGQWRRRSASWAARTVGAWASEGPYQVRWRPSRRAYGRPGKASGPSVAVKR